MNAAKPDSIPAGRPILALIGWLALCFAASITGVFVSTTGWYAGLHKPSWNPPGWIFGPAWTLLYVLMAIAACWSGAKAGGKNNVCRWDYFYCNGC